MISVWYTSARKNDRHISEDTHEKTICNYNRSRRAPSFGMRYDITGTDKLIRIISRGHSPIGRARFFGQGFFSHGRRIRVQHSGKILVRRDKEYCAAGTADKRAALDSDLDGRGIQR